MATVTGGAPLSAFFQYSGTGNGLVSLSGTPPANGTTVPAGKYWIVDSVTIINKNTAATEIRLVQRMNAGATDVYRSNYEPMEPTYGQINVIGPFHMVAADFLKLDISNAVLATLALDISVDYREYEVA